MESYQIIHIFMLFMLLILCIGGISGLAGAGIAAFRERKRRLTARDKTAASYETNGVILDAQLIQDPPDMPEPLHYKYSIRYTDIGGGQHRAFIGISSNTPLNYVPGEAIPLHIFQQSVIIPDAHAFDPSRGAAGRIDCVISFRKWLDKPVDETGTVMLEKDYADIAYELDRKIKSQQTAGWLWLISAGLTLIITVGVCIALVLEF